MTLQMMIVVNTHWPSCGLFHDCEENVNACLSSHLTLHLLEQSQNWARRAFVFIKHIHFWFFSLDKTLIHHLVSFIALWSCSKTVILTLNHLESIEVHYMDKYINNLDDMRVSKLSGHFDWKWTNPLISLKKSYWPQTSECKCINLVI